MKTAFQKIYLISSILFLVFSCFIFYFFNSKIESNNILAHEENILWQEEATRRAEIKSLDRAIKMINEERIELEKHFVYNSNLVPFLNTIEGFGTKLGSQAETLSVDLSADKLNLLVGLRVVGKFEAIYKFLLLLENSPYELEILSVDIQKQSSGEVSQTSSWTAFFRLKLISFIN